MKKIIFVLSILPILTGCASLGHKQFTIKESNPDYKTLNAFENDTLEYVKHNFYENQQFYVDKPLKILLDDMESSITDFSIHPLFNPIDMSDGVTFTFTNTNNLKNEKQGNLRFIDLNIKFKERYFYDDALRLKNTEASVNWEKEQKDFYKDFIIERISVYIPEPKE